MQRCKLTFALLMLAAFGVAAQARAKVVEGGGGSISALTSIGDALDAPDHHPVHVLYVHGIDQIGAGDSNLLRESICTRLKLCDVSDWTNAGVDFADKGEFAPGSQPPALEYLGTPVWNNPGEWQASAPFVVHWFVHLRGHSSVLVVDEINWWPLLLSLKCRRIMVPEAYLAGPDRQLLQVCSESAAQDPGGIGRFYPWIPPDQAQKLEAIRSRAVLINRNLKDSLVDWGLGDVMLAVGQLNGILRDGLRQLMAKSAAFDPVQAGAPAAGAASSASVGLEAYDWQSQLKRDNTLDREFIGVTHSLGSYLLFNTLNLENVTAADPNLSAQEAAREAAEDRAVRYIFERTTLVYFFANQIQMLEITNLETPSNTAPSTPVSTIPSRGPEAPPPPIAPAANFRALVNRWNQLHLNFQTVLHPADESARKKVQVVAWSDPSDVITFRVPRIGDVDVVNLYVQNAFRWFGLFEAPGAAHGNYAKNKDVLRVMFAETTPHGAGH